VSSAGCRQASSGFSFWTRLALKADQSSPGSGKAIGIFGGTFDPVHVGHLQAAREIWEKLGLVEVRLVPAFQSPHRDPPVASADHRLAMIRRAIANDPRLTVDDREIRRGGLSYSVQTLEELRSEVGQRGLVLVIGMDQFRSIERWFRWTDLFRYGHLAVVNRPGTKPTELPAWAKVRIADQTEVVHQQPAGRIVMLDIAPHDISATDIRKKLAAGGAVDDLLPVAVIDYIHEQHIYDLGGRTA